MKKDTLGDRLSIMKSHFNLTQSGLAATIGMAQSALSMFSSGDRSMSQQVAMAFQAALGVRWQWLISGEGEMLLENAEHMPDDVRRISEIFVRLTPEERMKITAFAEGFLLGKVNRKE